MVSHGTDCWRLAALSLCLLFVETLSAFQLQDGDLLFVCPAHDNAITQVTTGVEGRPIDHVAIVRHVGGDGGPLFVVEAVKPAVRIVPIDTFLVDNAGADLLVGRVSVDMDVTRSLHGCLNMVGLPYDDLYLPGDSALYCSELVQINYVTTAGTLIFEPIPMSFHDGSGRVTDYWQHFYSTRGMTVPEAMPGSNPADLSRRPQLTILGQYPSRP